MSRTAEFQERTTGTTQRMPNGKLVGVVLCAVLGLAAVAAAQTPWAASAGLSALTFAILLGILAGNTFFDKIAPMAGAGVDFARGSLLRLGIILYGFHITFQQIAAVGWGAVAVDAAIVCTTFTLAVVLGTRLFKLDCATAMLIGAGSSICGAAAVMATQPVIRSRDHKVSVAIATVVVFGTVSMFAYPLLYPWMGLSEKAYGVFVGSTIHEVAQVVAAGGAVGADAASAAVIVKMLRVMMLAPFLLVLSGVLRSGQTSTDDCRITAGANPAHRRKITIPWFAFLFIAASGINSMGIVPSAVRGAILHLDAALLATAMAALGLRTQISAVKQAGVKPLLLGLVLFLFLTAGGYGINRVLMPITG